MKSLPSLPSTAVLSFLLILVFAVHSYGLDSSEVEPLEHPEKIVLAASGGGKGSLTDTLPAIAIAATSESDFIELNLVVTRDDEIVIHPGLLLENTTNVSELFPGREREDGHFYVTDFSLTEVRQLRKKTHWLSVPQQPSLGIPTLRETLSLLSLLDADSGKKTGIAPHILYPEFHIQEGKDISEFTLLLLHEFGYDTQERPIILQCIDGDELQRIKKKLMPAIGLSIPLMQRIEAGETQNVQDNALPVPYDHSWMFTRLGMRVVSSYADTIALHTSYIDKPPVIVSPTFLEDARALGLTLYTFPVNNDSTSFPEGIASYPALLEHYYTAHGIDGIITSSWNTATQYLNVKKQERLEKQNKENSILNINLQPLTLQERTGSRIILHSSSSP